MDGILGLGRGDTIDGTVEAPSLLDVFYSSKLIAAKLYGVHLSRASDGTNDGELNFGEPNQQRYSGDLNWLDTVENDRGFWEVQIAGAGADSTSSGVKGRTGVLDTGTSLMLMPPDDAVAMHKLIEGSTQSGETFTVPCDTKTEMQITFGSTTYNISTADWVGGTLPAGGCKSNIIGRQTFNETQWLLGDVFLKNVYSVFDFDNAKVGFGVLEKGNGNGEGNGETPTTSTTSTTSTVSVPTGLSEATPNAQSAQEASAGQVVSCTLLYVVLGTLGSLVVLA